MTKKTRRRLRLERERLADGAEVLGVVVSIQVVTFAGRWLWLLTDPKLAGRFGA